ncbi:GNAT family N-acetyltransferase [Actinophytocola gossypii]|uniref:GNAT family N-acetyltransferase n=1 Tax=Actinophytocola gossypii TaxID=2812003 RepID=A0ABT2JGQ9_9PSEU|nr:GNAT family N-acetyltransferase [Actinophytocola gossypii]MCT2587061.1 GNAT family N-acetyltransferase [Actinophytocola gossypii]
MTAVDDRTGADAPPFATRTELVSWWDNTWLVRAVSADGTVLTCLATRTGRESCLLDELLPRRRDPRLAGLLVAAADRVRDDLGVTTVLAVHPADWDEHLSGHGVTPLHRMAHLGLLLDDEQLRAHHRPLPDGHAIVPLHTTTEADLAGLSTGPGRERDLAVWRDVRSGGYGPVIADASLAVGTGSGVTAAIAVSEYRGRPLIGHCVTGEAHRGHGLGRAVLVESLRRLAAAGYADCHLNVVADNWIAHRLYRSVGFSPRRPPLRVTRIPDGGVRHGR